MSENHPPSSFQSPVSSFKFQVSSFRYPILIAEDDPTSRTLLAAVLRKGGHEVVEACDGGEAWDVLQRPDAPRLAILDWMMPGLDGVAVVRNVRAVETDQPPYLIMLTTRNESNDIIEGLHAGADDYLVKPWDPENCVPGSKSAVACSTYRTGWLRRSGNWRRRWIRSELSRAFFPSAVFVKRFETTATTGARWKTTWALIRKPDSAMAYAPTA